MTTRIGNYAETQIYLSQLATLQNRLNTNESQVATGLVSTVYSGIATQAYTALSLQNEKTNTQQYIDSSAYLKTQLSTQSTAMSAIQTTIDQFSQSLTTYATTNPKDQSNVQNIQNEAYNSMMSIAAYLNTNIGGDYLFSGARTATEPVQFGFSSLSQFQQTYNGSTVSYPITNPGDLLNANLTSTDTGAVSFVPNDGTIVPTNAAAYQDVSASGTITIGGTNNNNGTYTVLNHAPTNLAGVALTETSNAGSNAFITYSGGNIVNSTTGPLSFAFNQFGQMTMSAGNSNSLANLTTGTNFTISGSVPNLTSITAADGTALVNGGLYTYTANSSASNPINIKSGDSLTVSNGTNSYTFYAGNTGETTVANLVSKLNGAIPGLSTSVDNQGHIVLTNTSGSAISVSGPLATTLGLSSANPGTIPSGGGTLSTVPLFDNVNVDPLTSYKVAGQTAPIAAGDTLTMNGATFTVGNNATNAGNPPTPPTTMADLANFIQKQDPTATVSVSGGKLTITGTTSYTISGTLATYLGISGTNSSFTSSPLMGTHDGAFTVLSNDGTTVTLANADGLPNATSAATNETVAVSSLGLVSGTADSGPPATTVTPSSTTGNATFTTSGSTVTMTLPTGTTLAPALAAGDALTISGTADHNGTFTVNSASGNTVTFSVNPDALRVSQFVPQAGRTDVTLSYPSTTSSGSATTTSFTATNYGTLSFSPTGYDGAVGETITASTPGAFQDVGGNPQPPVGTVFSISSPNGVNNGSYKVVSNDRTHIVVENTDLTAETAASSTLGASSWYKGDTMSIKQGVSSDQTISVGINAQNPAFEKALRAMAIIAQGVFGTAGGLDQNQGRVADAQYLLQSAMNPAPAGTPPYGTEPAGNMSTLQSELGVNQTTVQNAVSNQTNFVGFLDTQISSIEQADPSTAITKLLADQTALQGSYQAMSSIWNLSLLNYIK